MAAVADPAPGGARRRLLGVVGIILSLAFLVLALRGVDPAEVWHHLRRANYAWFALSVATVTATFPLRTVRWRILLAPSAGPAPWMPTWHATAIGFMANNVLPARAGELVRSYAATRLVGVPFSTALASVAVERVFDGLVLVLLLALAIASPDLPSGATVGTRSPAVLAAGGAALFAGVLLFLLALVRNQARVLPVAERLLRRVMPARLHAAAVRVLHNLTAGLAVLHSTRDLLRVLVWSLVVWLVNAASYVFAFHAFGLAVPATAALLLQGVVAFGVAVPQAPGFFGVFELGVRYSLAVYGVAPDAAVSFAVSTHLGWFVPITIIGLVILARTGLRLHDLGGAGRP